jgi:hypothetical protein
VQLNNLTCPKSQTLISSLFTVYSEQEFQLFYHLLEPIILEYRKGHLNRMTLELVRNYIILAHEKNLKLATLPYDPLDESTDYWDEAIETLWESHWKKFQYIDLLLDSEEVFEVSPHNHICESG